MQLEDFTQFTTPCFHGEPASCSCACPFGMDIRGFMTKCAGGKWNGAWKHFRTAVTFPAVVAALCPAPCQAHCQREGLGGSVAIHRLEEAAIRFSGNRKNDGFNIPPKTQNVAVVGAGAAGLSAALHLALKKYIVTVFDRNEGWGGSLREHPRFTEFDEDFRLQFAAVKAGFIRFCFQTEIRDSAQLEGYDAVYFATGRDGLRFDGGHHYFGGALIGKDLMESIAMGAEVSKAMESFLMTGRAEAVAGRPHSRYCNRYVAHRGVPSAAPVETESEAGARAEAGRCMQCDCSECIESCELLKRYRKTPQGIAREAYADSAAAPPIATQSLVRQTYSCTNCGKCREVCPENADLGALFMLSRSDRFRRNTGPKAFHDYWLRELDFAANEAAVTLNPPDRDSCKYAFFPGCRLGMDAPEQVRAAYAELLRQENGAVGLMLGCCGVPALWAGDRQRLEENRLRILAGWEKLGKPAMILACATCERTFADILPEIPTISLYEKLAGYGIAPKTGVFSEAVVFDPCAARAESGMRASVRRLAEDAGTALRELEEKFRCCGFGGHIQIPNPRLFGEIVENRASASELPYVVYCANCREVFKVRGKDCRHILEYYFGDAGEIPGLLKKRENALALKQGLMKEYWNMDFTPETQPWDTLKLTLAEGLREKLEQCFISEADLRETIWTAETGKDKLIDDGGRCLASLIKPCVTYWVQYRPTGEDEASYFVETAYSHRMKWRGTI